MGLVEGLDGLFVVDDSEGASPVGTPQAAFETPGVEHAGEGVPDVRERIGFAGQRAGTADLDDREPYPLDRKSTRLNSSHTEIYTLSLHDALPIWRRTRGRGGPRCPGKDRVRGTACRHR